ncbi:hypothetical protein VYU27_004218 [Nannochloropsis oceanica]
MAKTMSTPWILPAVKAALGAEDSAGRVGASNNKPAGPSDHRPKVVQVVRGSTQHGYLEVSDKENKIAVFLTPDARQSFHEAMPQKSLSGLSTCMVKLEKWLVSYLPLAVDSATGSLAHHLPQNTKQDAHTFAPLCLVATKFTVVLSERGQSTYGNPRSINTITEIKRLYRELDPSALITKLATGQGLPRLPDSTGADALPDPVDNQHPVTLTEVKAMLAQDAAYPERRIAGVNVATAAAAAAAAAAAVVAKRAVGAVEVLGGAGNGAHAINGGAAAGQQMQTPAAAETGRAGAADAATVAERAGAIAAIASQAEDEEGEQQEEGEAEGKEIDEDDRLASQFGASPAREFETQRQEEEEEEEEEEESYESVPVLIPPPSPARSTRSAASIKATSPTRQMQQQQQEEEAEQQQQQEQRQESPSRRRRTVAAPVDDDAKEGKNEESKALSPKPGGQEEEGKKEGEGISTRSPRAQILQAGPGSPHPPSPAQRTSLRRNKKQQDSQAWAMQTQAFSQDFSQTQVDESQQEEEELEEEEEEEEEKEEEEEDELKMVLRRPSVPFPSSPSPGKRPAPTVLAGGGGGGPSPTRVRLSAPTSAAAAATARLYPAAKAAATAASACRSTSSSTPVDTSSLFGGRPTIWGLLGMLKPGGSSPSRNFRKTGCSGGGGGSGRV